MLKPKPVAALFICVYALGLCGCASFKESSKKFGQAVADGSYNTYKAIESADRWFQENCW